ncbi:DUF4390 domain-containing protein [Halothiobacillus sp.]|uniref:DUF4390 domain-containing protein n=1 Tax=Halothiobacillus sp. TaxID=1891311 RepID=UPI002AD5598D|nr:DUF4390 domain-containing protein [Halothiobacillus sp.]
MMVSTTPCWKRHEGRADGVTPAARPWVLRWVGWLFLWLLVLQGGFVSKVFASSAQVKDAHAEVREGVLYLDVDFKLVLDKEMIDAMQNAIPLNLTVQAVIEQPRDWWVGKTIAEDDRRYQLEYHALSKTWLITDVLEHEARSFSSLRGALRSLQRIRAWPIAASQKLQHTGHLVGRVRMTLDINKLPLPLRFPALFDSRWALNSDWFLWSVPK